MIFLQLILSTYFIDFKGIIDLKAREILLIFLNTMYFTLNGKFCLANRYVGFVPNG